MTDISASYHYEPDYEDMLAVDPDGTSWDGGYKDHFRYLRQCRRLRKMLKDEHIWIDGWHVSSTRYRKLPWYEEIVAIMKDATDKGEQLHRKVYLDALRRAQQHEATTEGTEE